MKVEEIEYTRTFNLGNYESERITVMVSVDETENPFDVFIDLKTTVFKLQEEGRLLEESKEITDANEPQEPEKPTLEDINSLTAHQKYSEKGPYQVLNKAENMNNPAFERLHAYVANNDGFAVLQGHKFWIFSNNSDTIGYRKQ